jgi:hypothetical protein
MSVRPSRILKLLIALFVLAGYPASSGAQQTAQPGVPSAARDLQSTTFVSNVLAALTGGAPVTDITLMGTVRRIAGSDDETGTAAIKATVLGDSRLDFSFPSGTRSEIRNHAATPLADSQPPDLAADLAQINMQSVQSVGSWSGPDGIAHGIANHNLLTDAAWFFPPAVVTRVLSSPGYVFTFIGPETHEGQLLSHLQMSQPPSADDNDSATLTALIQHASQMDLYVDPNSLLPTVLDFYTHPDNTITVDTLIEIRFSDYREVNGIQIPFHIQKYINNGLALDIQIEDAAVNSGISPTTFDIR